MFDDRSWDTRSYDQRSWFGLGALIAAVSSFILFARRKLRR